MNCLTCGEETLNPKYCNKSCSAKATGKIFPKRKLEKSCSRCLGVRDTHTSSLCRSCREEGIYLRKSSENVGSLCSKSIGKDDIQKRCPKCEQVLDLKEFYIKTGARTHSYCRSCVSKQTSTRQKEFKARAVEYKGGKCMVCRYDKCVQAMDFHHRDPTKKDFAISRRKSLAFNILVKVELDKCVLLCANCHREVHAGLIVLP